MDQDVLSDKKEGVDSRPYWEVEEIDRAALNKLKGEMRKIAASRKKN